MTEPQMSPTCICPLSCEGTSGAKGYDFPCSTTITQIARRRVCYRARCRRRRISTPRCPQSPGDRLVLECADQCKCADIDVVPFQHLRIAEGRFGAERPVRPDQTELGAEAGWHSEYYSSRPAPMDGPERGCGPFRRRQLLGVPRCSPLMQCACCHVCLGPRSLLSTQDIGDFMLVCP